MSNHGCTQSIFLIVSTKCFISFNLHHFTSLFPHVISSMCSPLSTFSLPNKTKFVCPLLHKWFSTYKFYSVNIFCAQILDVIHCLFFCASLVAHRKIWFTKKVMPNNCPKVRLTIIVYIGFLHVIAVCLVPVRYESKVIKFHALQKFKI